MGTTGSPFFAGEPCILSDVKDRTHLITLTEGATFTFDRGSLEHDDIIGTPEGAMVRSSKGSPLIAFRPRLADYVLGMKRGAAVLYPKDAGAVITWGDIGPGCTVLEAGTGSGALTMALSRAVGESGRVVTCEVRDDHAKHARRLIETFSQGIPGNIEFREGDVIEHVADVSPDRIVLDLPEPWTVVEPAAEHLAGGGTLVAYVPTVPQMQQLRETMDESGVFAGVDSFEIMMRSWAVDGRSVRPEHRMVGHTGFLTVGRRRVKEQFDAPDRQSGGSTERP